MYKILVIITCIVLLTVHWNDFTGKVDVDIIINTGKDIMEKVKE
tara:strand:+ start:232 stop:363 length:132 start_codon:yes stop_codon:yes gene_type:complete